MDLQAISCILGLFVGFVLGLTGAGGGVLSVPLLVTFLHLDIAQAVPISLLAIMISAGIGAALGIRAGIVRYKAAGLMAACGFAMLPLGVAAGGRMPNILLALFFVLILGVVSIRMLRHHDKQSITEQACGDELLVPCQIDPQRGKFIWTAPCAKAVVLAGGVAGFLSGMLGVGGGFLIVPALHRMSNLDIRSIVATSLAVMALISLMGMVMFALRQAVDWDMAWPFAAASLIGLLVGRKAMSHLPAVRIRQSFALIALLAGVSMLAKLLYNA